MDESKPSIAEMVCFIESLVESETPLEMTKTSSGSIHLSILAIMENLRLNPDFLVETKSSETPPPATPEIRQLTADEEIDENPLRLPGRMDGSHGRMKRWRSAEREGGG